MILPFILLIKDFFSDFFQPCSCLCINRWQRAAPRLCGEYSMTWNKKQTKSRFVTLKPNLSGPAGRLVRQVNRAGDGGSGLQVHRQSVLLQFDRVVPFLIYWCLENHTTKTKTLDSNDLYLRQCSSVKLTGSSLLNVHKTRVKTKSEKYKTGREEKSAIDIIGRWVIPVQKQRRVFGIFSILVKEGKGLNGHVSPSFCSNVCFLWDQK